MDVLIVGGGEIGRWVAETLDEPVAVADADPETATETAAAVGGRQVDLDTDERFDALLLAVPMNATTAAIERHADKATEAVLDFAGVMQGPIEAMAREAPDRERASLHPLFAPENAPGRIAIVADEPGPVVRRIRKAFADRANEFVETTPTEHDRAMETVQARAHAALLAFALAAEPVPEGFGTPVYDALQAVCADVTGGTPRIYADIQATFAGAEDVAEAAAEIAGADQDTFEELYRKAATDWSE